mgnify:CR=1 FL=1
MTDEQFPCRSFPCAECPWRADVEPGQFPAGRYDILRRTSVGENGAAVFPGTPMFGCHKGEPGSGADLACAGWLAVAGRDHIDVRVAVLRGYLPGKALAPGDGWPPLYESYDAMAAAMAGEDPR